MKHLLRVPFGLLLAGGAFTLAVPEQATAWSTIGGNLSLSQRDCRIYDDFIDPTAHDNTVPHVNWPGYTEIELACWKAMAEWGARIFGDGTGDSTQTQVGDGNANFSFFWNGEASGTGGYNSNINSPIAGSSGGVLAYTETPISDGWRIRYYESWTWDDGPGSVSSSRIDFQGIACHELGHALGLGHSNNGAATMYAYAIGNGVANRSIELDDQNGIQLGIYSARNDSVMPRIDLIQGSLDPGGTCVLIGDKFSATGNEIWLNSSTLDAVQAGGDPYKITGVASTAGGTQISFVVPSSGIEAGAIHVKSGAGTTHAYLSEGEPFNYGGGGAGTNTIRLNGPTTAFAGMNAFFDFTNGAANTTTYLLWSLNGNGTTIQGHAFDIGAPWNLGPSTVSDATGAGSWTVLVPAAASGLTVYVEAAQNAAGTILDSNMLVVQIL